MDDKTRQKILAEAARNLASKDTPFVRPPVDPIAKWRAEGDALEEKYKQGALEVREEEAQRRRAAEANPVLWDEWFISQLRRHLHAHLAPSFEGIAQGVGGLYSELRHRADAQEKTIAEQGKTIQGLQLKLAQLAIRLAELKTDQVISQMPTAGAVRGTVN
jgi:hypothetical protein